MNLLQLSWKNLSFRPFSTLLIVVLFALGIGLISFLLNIETQIQEKFEKNQAGIQMVVGAKGSPLQLILCSMYHIDAPTGNILLKEAAPLMNPNHPIIAMAVPLSLGDNYRGHRIVGTTQKFPDLYQGKISAGSWGEEVMDVVVGANVSTSLNLQVGSTFRSSHGLINDTLSEAHEHPFVVKGIYAPTGSILDELITTPLESIWHVHEHHDAADHVETDHPEEEAEKAITSLLIKFKGTNIRSLNFLRNINENTNMQAANPALEINRLYLLMGSGLEAIQWLGWLIMLVSGFSVLVALLNALSERKKELALLRILGASPIQLLFLIIFEGVLLALLGYGLGIILSHSCLWLAADQLQKVYNYAFNPVLFLPAEAWLFVGALCIGVITAFYPAIKAYRTNLHETLSES